MNKTVLILDDNQEILILLKNILETHNFKTITFSSSKEALNYLIEDSDKIDLILIDVVMPEFDGMEIIDELKKKHNILKIPYIYISAKNEDFLKKLTAYDPDSVFIQKPIDTNELLNKINSLLT